MAEVTIVVKDDPSGFNKCMITISSDPPYPLKEDEVVIDKCTNAQIAAFSMVLDLLGASRAHDLVIVNQGEDN